MENILNIKVFKTFGYFKKHRYNMLASYKNGTHIVTTGTIEDQSDNFPYKEVEHEIKKMIKHIQLQKN